MRYKITETEELHSTLSKSITALRTANHLTQEQLANTLSVSRQAYSNYETNRRSPDLFTLLTLADFYDISLEAMIFYVLTDTSDLDGES